MSRIDEPEARLDALTTAILMSLRASKHVDRKAMDHLGELAEDLISEVGDAPAISRRLTTRADDGPPGRDRWEMRCKRRSSSSLWP